MSEADDRGEQLAPESLACSFCGKSQREVRKLIAGPTVSICDECITLCNDIIAEEIAREAVAPAPPVERDGISSLLGQLDRKLREVEELRRRIAGVAGL